MEDAIVKLGTIVIKEFYKLEGKLIGYMLLSQDDLTGKLGSYHNFYFEDHQTIYNAIKQLLKKGEPVDIITVAEELRQSDELDCVGGVAYLTKIANASFTDMHKKEGE